mmetsp:Transcript_24236/g.36348  ORF Transcript_24236/g.36348 Transcript_24236/m.36348 type:complete len:302 (+) Transcript_24236:87-992(+)
MGAAACSTRDSFENELQNTVDNMFEAIKRMNYKELRAALKKIKKETEGIRVAPTFMAAISDARAMRCANDFKKRGISSMEQLLRLDGDDWAELFIDTSHANDLRRMRNHAAKMTAKINLNEALLSSAKQDKAECLKILITFGGDINYRDDIGKTPAMWACLQGNTGALKILMLSNADLNIRGKDGRNARDLAKLVNQKHMVDILDGKVDYSLEQKPEEKPAKKLSKPRKKNKGPPRTVLELMQRAGVSKKRIEVVMEEGYDEIDWYHTANERDWERMMTATSTTRSQKRRIIALLGETRGL